MSSLAAGALIFKPATTFRSIQPWVLFSVKDAQGREMLLCDYATAGAYGNHYATWLPVKGLSTIAYSKDQPPVWTNRTVVK